MKRTLKLTILLLLIVIHLTSYGQIPTFKSNDIRAVNQIECELLKSNLKYWVSIEKEQTQKSKLALIKEKIIVDTTLRTQKSPYCGDKILFVLHYGKKKSIYIDLVRNPNYLALVQKLSEANIQNIYLLSAEKGGRALYGVLAVAGAIVLKTNDKKLSKEIKKLIE